MTLNAVTVVVKEFVGYVRITNRCVQCQALQTKALTGVRDSLLFERSRWFRKSVRRLLLVTFHGSDRKDVVV